MSSSHFSDVSGTVPDRRLSRKTSRLLEELPAAICAFVKVKWTLSVKKIDDKTCEYSNHIHGSAIDESMAFFEKHGISLEKARETPADSRGSS